MEVMIVGFTGRRRSGKDTAASALTDRGYERVSFAGPLKAMLKALLMAQGVADCDADEFINGALKEEPTALLNGRSPRYAMQSLGTEWGRDLIDTNLWVDAALRTADGHSKVVFTDVRFPNEVEAIRRAGGLVLKIVRPSLGEGDEHSSEALIDTLTVDATIYNDGSVAELRKRVDAVLRVLS